MRRAPFVGNHPAAQRGVALLAVLAFVLILTILVVSYISFMKLNRLSTASYGNAVQAQEIALGGLQDILGDLHSEIIAGSTNNAVFTQSGKTVYVPINNFSAVPARLGYPVASWPSNTAMTTAPTTAPSTFLPTLIRVSRGSASTGTPTALNPSTIISTSNANGAYANVAPPWSGNS